MRLLLVAILALCRAVRDTATLLTAFFGYLYRLSADGTVLVSGKDRLVCFADTSVDRARTAVSNKHSAAGKVNYVQIGFSALFAAVLDIIAQRTQILFFVILQNIPNAVHALVWLWLFGCFHVGGGELVGEVGGGDGR